MENHDQVVPEVVADTRGRVSNILSAYAFRNQAIGYAQGMSDIVMALVQIPGFSDDDAFNILCHIVETVNVGYYDSALTGLKRDLRRLAKDKEIQAMFPIKEYSGDGEDVSKRTLFVLESTLPGPMMRFFLGLVPLSTALVVMDLAVSKKREAMLKFYKEFLRAVQPEFMAALKGQDGAIGLDTMKNIFKFDHEFIVDIANRLMNTN
jgi:hypothetical protein